MKTVQKLSLLTLALLVASCNEKVSPELQNSAATTPDATVAVPPAEYFFKITNTSPVLLNYKLHKTGTGNSTAACEVRNTTGLSSDIFRGNTAANDISCYFDAEELSLRAGGMNFQIEASANTCDFVGYSPFSYYQAVPGDSSGAFTQVTCANDTTTASHILTAAGDRGISVATASGQLDCGDWATRDIADGTRVKFSPTDDAELCRFNYPDTGLNCDIGEITINELVVTYTPPGDDPATQPETLKHEVKRRIVNCGGLVESCVDGAIKLSTVVTAGATSRVTEIYTPEINKDFKSEEYKFPKLIGTSTGSNRYANFRRNLASLNIDYVSADDSAPTFAAYKSAFGIAAFGKTFNPNLVDLYSANKKMDGSQLVTQAMIDSVKSPGNMYVAVPLAGDPFMGLSDFGGERVSPFYTFYCFDTAYDIKARVRMVVRDWDRVFPTNDDIEYLSDIWRGVNSKQDNPNYVELPDDEDTHIPFNDIADWDDIVPMQRTSGAYVPASTIWQPLPVAGYPDGFFNPSIFAE